MRHIFIKFSANNMGAVQENMQIVKKMKEKMRVITNEITKIFSDPQILYVGTQPLHAYYVPCELPEKVPPK